MIMKRYGSNGRMCEAIIHGQTLYLCGQVCEDGGTVEAQTEYILTTLNKKLEKYGSCQENILSALVFLTDIKTFDEFNKPWDAWAINGSEPVRACVEAQLAKPQYSVEICIVAAINE